MKYNYAIIDNAGKCYSVRNTVNYVCSPYYVPINQLSTVYLSKYYWPVSDIVDFHNDFNGEWYLDASHTIKGGKELNGY